MPIVVEEKFDSRTSTTGANASVELKYIVFGTGSDLSAKSALGDESPETYDGLARQSIGIEPLANEVWEGSVRYGVQEITEPPQEGDSTFAFDTGGGTQHITHARSTIGRYAPSGTTAPDFQGAIGVTDNGVEGVDVTIPVYQFSETHYFAPAYVTLAYRNTLFYLTGKVNAGSFRGLSAGECLFLGASGSRRGTGSDDPWEITYRFAGSPNVTGLSVGPISGIEKKGWEYLWVRYADAEDDAAKILVKRPIGAYIEQVYDYASFLALGIGS